MVGTGGPRVSHVFISYKREDQARVAPLVDALRAGGIDTWWDQDIPPGGSWRETIADKLDSCRLCVAMWSVHSVGQAGRFVREEAERAARRKAYLGVLIDPVPPPFGFSEWQAIDLAGWRGRPDDPLLGYVVETVRSRLDGAAPPTAEAIRPATGRRGLKRPLLFGLGLVALLIAAFILRTFLSAGPPAAPPSPTEFVNGQIAGIDCTWAQISAVPPSDSGLPMQLSGVASAPPVVRDLLLQRAQAQGVRLADVDVRDVAATPQSVCPQLNTLRPFRVPNSDRFQVVPERGSLLRAGGSLSGLVEVEFDLSRIPAHAVLLGLDDENGLEVLIPDIRRTRGRGNDPTRPILDLVFEDEGRNVRNVGLLLLSAETPIALSSLLPEKRPDTADALARLARAAQDGRWKVELGLVRCGFERGPEQRC